MRYSIVTEAVRNVFMRACVIWWVYLGCGVGISKKCNSKGSYENETVLAVSTVEVRIAGAFERRTRMIGRVLRERMRSETPVVGRSLCITNCSGANSSILVDFDGSTEMRKGFWIVELVSQVAGVAQASLR